MGFKSDKDREAFVEKLTAAGFGPDEINAEVASIEKSAPAPAPVAPPAIKPSSQMGGGTTDTAVAPPLAPSTPTQVQTKAADLTAAREAAGNTLADQFLPNLEKSDYLRIPLEVYGVYKGAQALKDRMFTPQTPQYPTGPEPTMGAEPPLPENKLPSAAQQKTYTPKEAAVAGNITEKYPFSLEEAKAGLGIPEVKITNPTDAEIVAKQYSRQLQAAVPSSVPAAAAPVAPVTPAPVETAPVVTAPISETPPPAPVEEIKPAPVAETPKTPAPPPEAAPKAAVPPEEKLTKQQKGMKGHLVSMYGGGSEGEAAYAKVKEILGYTPEYPPGKGGSLTSEEHQIIKDWRKANIEGPKVNLTHEMKKGMTSGAGLAVLMSIPGFAEAAQNRDFGKMTDIATDLFVLPFAQSRATGENESYELAKRRYEGMVGGGRGIAPPSPRQQVGRR